eukprot:2023627-Prymnesium_polylepis.1
MANSLTADDGFTRKSHLDRSSVSSRTCSPLLWALAALWSAQMALVPSARRMLPSNSCATRRAPYRRSTVWRYCSSSVAR